MSRLLILVCALLVAICHGYTPMSCIELTVNITGSGQFGNYSITGDLKYIYAQGKDAIVNVNNVASISYDTGKPAQTICQIPFNNCNSNLSMAYNYSSPFEFFETSISIDGFNIPFWRGYVDESSLSANNGFVYSPNNTCMTWKNPSLGTHQECCKTFAPASPPTIIYPKCKAFESKTTVTDFDGNNLFASIYMNYTLDRVIVTGNGNYTGPTNTKLFFRLTDFMASVDDNNNISGNATLPTGDAKFFAFAMISPSDNDYLTVGRFIIRNNQTLFIEGIPFSYQQRCIIFTETFSVTQNFNSKFCCTAFEDL